MNLPFFNYADCCKLIKDLTLKYHPNYYFLAKGSGFEDCQVRSADASKTIVVLTISKDHHIDQANFEVDVFWSIIRITKSLHANLKIAITSDAIGFTGLSIDTARYFQLRSQELSASV